LAEDEIEILDINEALGLKELGVLSRPEVEQMRAGLSSAGPFARAILYNSPQALFQAFFPVLNPILDDAINDAIDTAINPLPKGILAKSQKTTNQTGITSVTDVTDLSVTWDASPERLYLTSVYLNVNQGASNATAGVFLTDASNAVKQDASKQVLSGSLNPICFFLYESGLSGSVTRKVRVSTNASNIAVRGDATYPAQITTQDVGLA